VTRGEKNFDIHRRNLSRSGAVSGLLWAKLLRPQDLEETEPFRRWRQEEVEPRFEGALRRVAGCAAIGP